MSMILAWDNLLGKEKVKHTIRVEKKKNSGRGGREHKSMVERLECPRPQVLRHDAKGNKPSP